MKMLVTALFCLLLAGCGTSQPPAPNPKLGISNGTTLTVTLVVNGQSIADFPPGGPDPTVDVAALPPLPWTVDARSPSGRLLTSMEVRPGDVRSSSIGPSGEASYSGTFGRIDLSCGRITIWAGDVTPSGPAPVPSPGKPGDCAP
jgi:hypothetical protein